MPQEQILSIFVMFILFIVLIILITLGVRAGWLQAMENRKKRKFKKYINSLQDKDFSPLSSKGKKEKSNNFVSPNDTKTKNVLKIHTFDSKGNPVLVEFNGEFKFL